jgi:hypothetical protein
MMIAQLPEWLFPTLVAAVLGAALGFVASLLLLKRKEKLKVILDLEIKPRTQSALGAWAVVSNLSSVPIWLERLTFVAEELGTRGRPVNLDAGRTIDSGDDERIECHGKIFEAFQETGHSGEPYVGYVEITATVRSNGARARKARAYQLTSGMYGVQDVEGAPGRLKRLLGQLTEYVKIRVRLWKRRRKQRKRS